MLMEPEPYPNPFANLLVSDNVAVPLILSLEELIILIKSLAECPVIWLFLILST